MRVLLVHNYYGSSAPSGENEAFDLESKLLRDRGHVVARFVCSSDTIRARGLIGKIQGALSTTWNPRAYFRLRAKVREFQPDVVHIHNTFPMMSPAVFHAVGRSAATVLTLHNYRIFCPAAVPLRAGQVCTKCLDTRSAWPSFRHGCYRGSRVATLPLTASVALHRAVGTWDKHVDAFITLSDFQRQLMVSAGLPEALVHVKPNFFPGNPTIVPWGERRRCVVFAGRLTSEKGVAVLVEAWIQWGSSAPELLIIGDGDLRVELEKLAAAASDVRIRFLGNVDSASAQKEIARAQLLVIPSECFEGFPLVLREAFAFGTPVAVSDIGPLPSFVINGENGVVFESGNSQSLQRAVQTAWQSTDDLQRMGSGARKSFETSYTEEENYRVMTEIYEQSVDVNKERRQVSQ